MRSTVVGSMDPGTTWAITAQPGGGDGTLMSMSSICNDNGTFGACAQAVFHATVTGHYVITATSVANGSLSDSCDRCTWFLPPNRM